LLLLFTILATYFWLSVVKALDYGSRVPTGAILGYILSAAVASYLHYFGLYLISLQGLGAILLFVGRLKALRYIVLVYALVLLLYLPWLLPIFGRLDQYLARSSSLGAWIPPVGPWTVKEYLAVIFQNSKALGIVFLALYLFLLLRGVYEFLKAREYMSIRTLLLSPGMLLALWLVVPFAIAYVISVLWQPVLVPRYLLISLPAAYLLGARAITQLPLRPKTQVGLVTVIAGLLLLHLLAAMDYYTKPHNEQFREAVQFAIRNERADTLIVGCSWGYYGPNKIPWPGQPAKFDYYFEQQGSDRRVQMVACEAKNMPAIKKRIDKRDYRFVLYLTAHNQPEPQRPLTLSLLHEFELISQKKLVGANAYLFSVNPDTASN
jgi:mannosyltransferase